MTFVRTALLRSMLSLSAAALFVSAAARPAAAQAPTQTRIAVVNPAKVFNDMAETKALQVRMAEDQKRFESDSKARATKLEEMKRGLGDLKPDSPQANAANEALMTESVNYKVWGETERAKAEFKQKRQMKALFDKIQVAIATVAKRDGIDLVIADSSERLPDDIGQMDMRALRAMILQKNVLFVNPNKQGLDITAAVQLQLDAEFKAAGPAAGTGK
ncbi:MAG: hypothetical protein AVDCRST_MAG64-1793 [uncultured Phycisphaerae bacterium]|uniref:Outer membrane protein H n=1 Tax=uncultured Phycisphaerae bacterium TaxID=904963 RepID=A0A6J4P060_9BACT|nr:MAG: hypothetical protein AVDCRST_MAG64-1793 [uncultured Phycisphaerae bacterium]